MRMGSPDLYWMVRKCHLDRTLKNGPGKAGQVEESILGGGNGLCKDPEAGKKLPVGG